jgi:hypothetical protein
MAKLKKCGQGRSRSDGYIASSDDRPLCEELSVTVSCSIHALTFHEDLESYGDVAREGASRSGFRRRWVDRNLRW